MYKSKAQEAKAQQSDEGIVKDSGSGMRVGLSTARPPGPNRKGDKGVALGQPQFESGSRERKMGECRRKHPMGGTGWTMICWTLRRGVV